jgi:hypothetical protein
MLGARAEADYFITVARACALRGIIREQNDSFAIKGHDCVASASGLS